jgi:hypothetical protein
VAGNWRRLHNEELRNLYTSSDGGMGVGHVARMKDKCIHNSGQET